MGHFRPIMHFSDCETLHSDLDKLAQWEQQWGMQFHPSKCNSMSVTRSKTPFKYNYLLKYNTHLWISRYSNIHQIVCYVVQLVTLAMLLSVSREFHFCGPSIDVTLLVLWNIPVFIWLLYVELIRFRFSVFKCVVTRRLSNIQGFIKLRIITPYS
jgi:hypothetical protein